MKTEGKKTILRIPLRIVHDGKTYKGEVVGKIIPFNKHFTCKIPGEDILIVEAEYNITTGRYSWHVPTEHEFSYLAPAIGREIEKYIA